MPQCISCRTKTSDERCSAKALKGLLVCGRHAKTKTPRLWTTERKVEDGVIQIQTLWRGYFVRKHLSLAGPGVLKRSLCHNEEDIITGTEKHRQHPFEYFAFEEAGKIWWFDSVSLLRWSVEHEDIVNPYTKQSLEPHIRKRLRDMFHFRIRARLPCLSPEATPMPPEKITQIRATRFVQQMHECEFTDIRVEDMLMLTGAEIWMFMNFVLTDMHVLASEHGTKDSRRKKYIWWIRESINHNIAKFGYFKSVQRHFFGTLLAILTDAVDPFPYCFVFASALYRL